MKIQLKNNMYFDGRRVRPNWIATPEQLETAKQKAYNDGKEFDFGHLVGIHVRWMTEGFTAETCMEIGADYGRSIVSIMEVATVAIQGRAYSSAFHKSGYGEKVVAAYECAKRILAERDTEMVEREAPITDFTDPSLLNDVKKMPSHSHKDVLVQHSEGNVDTPSLKDMGTI